MLKHILIYTDFPNYGIAIWNDIAKRNLEKYYQVTYVCSKKERSNFYEFLLNTKPDLVIFSDESPESNRFEKTKCILKGIPYISVAHLVTEQYVNIYKEKELVNYLLKGAIQVIAVSHSTLKSLHQLGLPNDKGVVVYPCFENIFNPKNFIEKRNPLYIRELFHISKNAKIFLTVARIDITKGYKTQLKVIHKLREQDKKLFENLHWIWVGNGPDYYKFNGILQDTGLCTNIHMLGQMSRQLMPDIYATSDVFVLPSFGEGTPIALSEAIAMELPIIATKVDGIKEILTDENAFLLDNPNEKSIDNMLEYAYSLFSTNNTITKKYKENIIKEREKYTEEIFTNNLLNVIKNATI